MPQGRDGFGRAPRLPGWTEAGPAQRIAVPSAQRPQRRKAAFGSSAAQAEFATIGTSLLNGASSGHEIDPVDDRFLTIMMPIRGRMQVRMERRTRMIQAGTALALGPSERWTRVERDDHRGFRAHVAKIPPDAGPVRHALPGHQADPVLATSAAALAGFGALLHYLFSDPASPAPTLIHSPASDLFAALVVEHLRLMFALDGVIGSEGLHLLAGSGATVTAMALDCGFSHLGSFAEAYRAAYGEAPSAKLWRAEGGTGAIRTGGPRSG